MNEDGKKFFEILFEVMQSNKKQSKKIVELKNTVMNEHMFDSKVMALSADQLLKLVQDYQEVVCPSEKVEPDINILLFLLYLQNAFYLVSEDIDYDKQLMYGILIDNHLELYNSICDAGNCKYVAKFTYEIDQANPMVKTLKELDSFYNAMKLIIKSIYNLRVYDSVDVPIGIMPFIVFYREIVGNEDKWLNRMLYMYHCYQALSHKKEGMSNRQLIKVLGYNVHDQPNSLKKVKKVLADAEGFMKSVLQGTFPY